jgi:hypothetical protein
VYSLCLPGLHLCRSIHPVRTGSLGSGPSLYVFPSLKILCASACIVRLNIFPLQDWGFTKSLFLSWSASLTDGLDCGFSVNQKASEVSTDVDSAWSTACCTIVTTKALDGGYAKPLDAAPRVYLFGFELLGPLDRLTEASIPRNVAELHFDATLNWQWTLQPPCQSANTMRNTDRRSLTSAKKSGLRWASTRCPEKSRIRRLRHVAKAHIRSSAR